VIYVFLNGLNTDLILNTDLKMMINHKVPGRGSVSTFFKNVFSWQFLPGTATVVPSTKVLPKASSGHGSYKVPAIGF